MNTQTSAPVQTLAPAEDGWKKVLLFVGFATATAGITAAACIHSYKQGVKAGYHLGHADATAEAVKE